MKRLDRIEHFKKKVSRKVLPKVCRSCNNLEESVASDILHREHWNLIRAAPFFMLFCFEGLLGEVQKLGKVRDFQIAQT